MVGWRDLIRDGFTIGDRGGDGMGWDRMARWGYEVEKRRSEERYGRGRGRKIGELALLGDRMR